MAIVRNLIQSDIMKLGSRAASVALLLHPVGGHGQPPSSEFLK